MGSALGVAKTAASKIGCTVEVWLERRANGERWCSTCRQWWFVENMSPEASRPDGIGMTCKACTHERWVSRRQRAKDAAA